MAETEKGQNFFKFAAQFVRFPSFKAIGEMTRSQLAYLIKAIDIWNEKVEPSSTTSKDPNKKPQTPQDKQWHDETLQRLTNMIENRNTELFG